MSILQQAVDLSPVADVLEPTLRAFPLFRLIPWNGRVGLVTRIVNQRSIFVRSAGNKRGRS